MPGTANGSPRCRIIPSDRKWYRNWAVAALPDEILERLDPASPPADFDIDTERRRIKES